MHPAGGVFAIVVPSQRRIRMASIRFLPTGSTVGKHARLQQRLKAVTDSQNQFVSGKKSLNCGIQVTSKLARKDDTGADVVAITESTGNAQDLIVVE